MWFLADAEASFAVAPRAAAKAFMKYEESDSTLRISGAGCTDAIL